MDEHKLDDMVKSATERVIEDERRRWERRNQRLKGMSAFLLGLSVVLLLIGMALAIFKKFKGG